ncbi:MAG: hypothetical protein JWO86_2165 [Myxococcaceae bacterium]|jgi:hypothetical protein|nr:hypothetical protein [Myxococcaceae bacterium]MEA2751183.1 hypothetical protein [Myxococcales bacterium]
MPDPDVLWRDPAHWTAFGYRCKDDPRVIVPKRRASMGWTLNWAHPWAAGAMLVLSVLAAGPMLVIVWLGQSGVVGPIGMVLAALVAVPLTIGLLVWFCRYASRVR